MTLLPVQQDNQQSKNPKRFPKTFRADRLDQVECDHDMPKKASVKVDLDSLVIFGTNFRHVIDTMSPPRTVWNFPSMLRRTNANAKSRLRIKFKRERCPRHHGTRNDFPLHWFPNTELCKVTMPDCGLELHVNFYNLGRGYITKSNFFTADEFCVILIA